MQLKYSYVTAPRLPPLKRFIPPRHLTTTILLPSSVRRTESSIRTVHRSGPQATRPSIEHGPRLQHVPQFRQNLRLQELQDASRNPRCHHLTRMSSPPLRLCLFLLQKPHFFFNLSAATSTGTPPCVVTQSRVPPKILAEAGTLLTSSPRLRRNRTSAASTAKPTSSTPS